MRFIICFHFVCSSLVFWDENYTTALDWLNSWTRMMEVLIPFGLIC